jgi:ABC-type ATPase involved in cell division
MAGVSGRRTSFRVAGVERRCAFSAIISFNETIRTTLVQGGNNTIQTYIWSQFLQVGLSPQLFFDGFPYIAYNWIGDDHDHSFLKASSRNLELIAKRRVAIVTERAVRAMLNQKISSAASAANPILRIAGITKSYGPKVVGNNLQLAIHKGELLTFLGASGSGKSTTLRIVAGLERADSGSVWISGRIVDDVPPWKRNLGMMFQQYAIFPHMSVAQNIGYGLRIRGQPAHVINKRVKSLLDLVGLAGMGEKRVTVLSGREQQRVALARALAPAPLVLLLDEPLSPSTRRSDARCKASSSGSSAVRAQLSST